LQVNKKTHLRQRRFLQNWFLQRFRAILGKEMKVGMSWRITVGFALSLGLIFTMAGLSYERTRELEAGGKSVAHSNQVLAELEGAVSDITEAETGVRGLLLT
jgi:CHASE3 domain sensor protein